MGKLAPVLIIGVVLALAYILNEDCPEEISQKWKVKTFLAVWRQSWIITDILKLFGHKGHVASRKAAIALTYILPNYYASDPGIMIRQEVFNGVPVYVYEPVEKKSNRRGVLYFHGGGWTVGSIVHYHTQMLRISRYLDAVAIFVDFRLAPEYPFPATFDDSLTATKYVINNAGDMGIDANRVALMGDSAGGNLAAVLSYNLKTNNFKPMPKLQVNIYPVVQGDDLDTPSYRYNKDGPFLTKDMMALFFATYLIGDNYESYIPAILDNNHTTPAIKKQNAQSYLTTQNLPKDDEIMKNFQPLLSHGNETLWKMMKKNLRDPRFTPMYVKDLSGLPPAYVSTCQYDVLRDDGYFYVKKLRDSGVKVHHVNLPCFHCWTHLHTQVDTADQDHTDMLQYIDENL